MTAVYNVIVGIQGRPPGKMLPKRSRGEGTIFNSRLLRRIMTDAAAKLLATFDSLPLQDQHELLTEMLRRSGELPSTLLTNDHLVGLADDLFQALDAEESDESKSSPK